MRCGIAVALVLLLAAAAPAWAAWPHDPLVNLQVAPPAAGPQINPSIVADGAGGALIAWTDSRSGNGDIYVQHVTAAGTVAPGWPSSGLAVCTAANDQYPPVAVADGAGGVLVAWSDTRPGSQRDIYIQRVTGAGTIAPGWPVNGRQVSTDTHDETQPVICSDGARGALLAWTLIFSSPTDNDVYGAHVDSAGTVVWSNAVASPIGIQDSPAIAADGAGGAVVVYRDNLSGSDDIMAVRRSGAGGVVYSTTVCGLPSGQNSPRVICDASGSATVTWVDYRGADADIYALRLTPSGVGAVGWFANGSPVCAETGSQSNALIASDGGSGSYIVWSDPRYGGGYDLFLQRLTPGGLPYPGWTPGGTAICTAVNGQAAEDLTPDGSAGVIVSFADTRVDGAQDIYAVRIAGNCTLGAGWTPSGVAVCAAAGFQDAVRACVDASGNAILTWTDSRSGNYAAYAQRVDVFGQLGNPEPSIAKIRDVLADQGGRVRVDWNASWLDGYPTGSISQYWIWRQAPAAQAQLALAHGAQLVDAASLASLPHDEDALAALTARGLYTRTSVNATTFTWEFVSAQSASAFPSYSYVAETTTDSTGAHNWRTAFMVQARGTASGTFWNSAPDSGYSVDNLPPVAPAPFLAAYSGGATHLHWGANTETDLAGYRLYRGSSSAFVPGAGNLVSAQPDTGYSDAGAAGSWYKLSAVDAHGNESVFAVLGPSGTTAVDGGLPRELAFAAPTPNPARAAAALGFALPRDARVSLAIYDAGGRRVRSLIEGPTPAGEHAIAWTLADDAGNGVASGLYFARLEVEGRTFVRRVAVLR